MKAPLIPSLADLGSATARLDDLVDRSGGPSACWPYRGNSLVRGYPVLWVRLAAGGRRLVKLHRLVAELANGEVDETVDHTCHDARTCAGGEACPHRRCLNPAHLAPEALAANASRNRAGIVRETCKRGGHPLRVTESGRRYCPTCASENRKARHAALPARERGVGEYRPRGMTREQLVAWGLDSQDGPGCWFWRGKTQGTSRDGYTDLRDVGSERMISAHRLVYEVLVGPIPDGHVVDHTCHGPDCVVNPCPHRACCRPDHLAAVLPGENLAAHRRKRRGNECKRGHDLADAYVDKRGGRHCRECGNGRQRDRRAAEERPDLRVRVDGRCANGHRIVELGTDQHGRCVACRRKARADYKARQRATVS